MMKRVLSYHKALFVSLILIAFGVVLQYNEGSSGTVLIAVGGFFLIVSIVLWQKERDEKHHASK